MHRLTPHQSGQRLWLFAGTGEGPALAEQMAELGWRLRVSVVTAEAALAYARLRGVELRIGCLDGPQELERELERARRAGDPFAVVVDATHPFALTIRRTLRDGCAARGQPLLRLERPSAPGCAGARLTLLPGLASLSRCPLAGERLLLAIGARQLARAVTLTQGALHHARLLPNPYGLQQAMAAGLAAERVACLRPTAEGRVEEALLLRWGITVVLARQSGGRAEAQWHQLANRRGCRLLLLRRPDASAGGELLSPAALMARLATWTAAG